jgi:protein tyrosine phosphatase (PTP) superfamily phosphohydrolase (DUF442 family)
LVLSLLLFLGQHQSAPAQSETGSLEDVKAYLRISDKLSTAGMIKTDQLPILKSAGFEVVVNLAPAHRDRNYLEGFNVATLGMTHVHIPVPWDNPAIRDLQMFFDVMDANTDRNVFVHCNANMRVSVFVYLYRTLKMGVSEEMARQDLLKIWDPNSVPQWAAFIAEATRKYRGHNRTSGIPNRTSPAHLSIHSHTDP